MTTLVLLPLMFAPTPLPSDVVTVTARVESQGRSYTIVIDIDYKDGWNGTGAGIPAPILQIDVPPSVKLKGKILKSYKALSRNEFLQEPFERLIKELPARIDFRRIKEPEGDERIGLNVLIYVNDGGDRNARFIRRRLELAPISGANATPGSPESSHWGQDDLLQIGDSADAFTLPRADKSTVSLDQFLGKKNVIVTTYRAFW